METSERKKKGAKGRVTSDDLELKLEEFYDSLEEDEKLEKLEDIRRLANESKELLRKVDALVELLIRAAQEEDEENYGAILTEISNGVSEIEERLKSLEELQKKLDMISPEFEKVRSSIEELKTFVSSSVSQSFSSIAPKIDRMSEILPSISERMELLSKISERMDKLDGLDDLYRKNAEVYDQVVTLKSAITTALDEQTKLLSRRLAAVYKKVRQIEDLRDNLETVIRNQDVSAATQEAISKEIESASKLLDEIHAKLPETEAEINELKQQLAEIAGRLKALDDLRARIDTLVVAIDHVPEKISSTVDERLTTLESGVKAVPDRLSSEIEDSRRAVITKVESLEERLSELDDLRGELQEIKKILSSRDKEKEWLEQQFRLLEKDVDAVAVAIEAVQKAISGSLDERKEAIQKLAKRTEKIVTMLHQMQTVASKEEEERIAALRDSLQQMFSQISDALAHLSSQEDEELHIFQDYVKSIDEKLSELEQRVAEGEATKSLASELDDISKRLDAVTGILRKNSSLLKNHAGDVAQLLVRFKALEEQIAAIRSGSEKTAAQLSKLQKEIESHLDDMASKIAEAVRGLRASKDSEVARQLKLLKESLSVVHSELMGILEAVKKYDTTSQLADISKRMEDIMKALEEGKVDRAAANRELADIEERLDHISSVISESDVKYVKSKLEDIYRSIDAVAESVKNARAILDEKELKSILRDLEAIRAYAREVRTAGLSDELKELRSRIKRLKALVESEAKGIKKGEIHHSTVLSHHNEVKRLVVPVVDAAARVRAIATVKESHAKRVKTVAQAIAKRTGSAHAHMVAAHSERILRTAKAMREIDRVVRKIQKKVEVVERDISGKRGSAAAKELPTLLKKDLVQAAAAQIARFVKRMKRGDFKRSDELAEELGMDEEVVKRALDYIERTGELAVQVKKPLLPFLGKHYTVIRL